MESDNSRELKNVFISALGIAPELATDDLAYNTVAEWDSIAHMALVAAIEEKYGIMLDTNDIIDMSSIAQTKVILAKYGQTF